MKERPPQLGERRLVETVALASLAVVLACSGDGDSDTSLRTALVERDVDLDLLFADPTDAEIDAARADWAGRQLGVRSLREEAAFTLDEGESMRVLSHRVGAQRHYGVVIVPAGEHLPGTLPVLISLVGFGAEMLVEIPTDARAYDDAYVTLFPSFRGHELRVRGQSWMSGGNPYDQCDGGADDAIAFVNAALEATPAADASSFATIGGSRGGNVGMLIGIRREDVSGVVNIAGPTDYLREELLDHPNMVALYASHFVRGLLDGTGDLNEARMRMLTCSPLHFAEDLPPTQAHHGALDLNVPFEQAELLAKRMDELRRSPPAFEFFAYEESDHQLSDVRKDIELRVDAFIAGLSSRDQDAFDTPTRQR
ncbi:MAG: prolyl oligopeptidase family serine peptidase [Polyangiales bacterium]